MSCDCERTIPTADEIHILYAGDGKAHYYATIHEAICKTDPGATLQDDIITTTNGVFVLSKPCRFKVVKITPDLIQEYCLQGLCCRNC